MLGVHARRRLGLQPRLAQPDEVPPRRTAPSTCAAFEHAVDIVLLAQEIVVGPSPLPDRGDRRQRQRVPPAWARLRQPRRLPDEQRHALRLRSRARDRRRDHRADDRPAYRASAEIAGAVGPYERYAENREAHNARHAHAPRRRLRDPRRRPAPTRRCSTAARRSGRRRSSSASAYGYRNAQATVLAPTGTISLPDGLRHDRRRAGLLAGQVQGARRRRSDDDRQPAPFPLALADARLRRAADRADRGAHQPSTARSSARPASRTSTCGLRRRGRRARDQPHGPHQDDGRRPAVHLGSDLEDRQPARSTRHRRGHRRRLHARHGASESRRSRSTATAPRRPRRCAPTPQDEGRPTTRPRSSPRRSRPPVRRKRMPQRAPVDHPQVLDRRPRGLHHGRACTRTERSVRSS